MKRTQNRLIQFAVAASLFQGTAFASSDGVAHFIDYYQLSAAALGIDPAYTSVLASLLVSLVCLFIGLGFRASVMASLQSVQLQNAGQNSGQAALLALAPSAKVTVRNFVEMILDFVYSLAKEHCGVRYRNFLPLLAGLFIFILLSNLSGLVPGLPPATENFNTNLAMGLIAFLCYNYAGIKEHGFHYIQQFTGPFLVLAPLFLMIEAVSHAVRPLSLAFRLLANIFCDHLLLGVFSGLVPLVVPSLFLFFGLLVALIQSFVFTLLTGIYVNMAISHDH